MQIYMPTSGYTDDAIEEIYEQIDKILELTGKNEKFVVLGDWILLWVQKEKKI